MNRKIKLLTLLMLVLACVIVVCSCNETAYDKNDRDGYNVSVKFDANGGSFGTNSTVVVDSYNISNLPLNENGMKEIYVVPTDSQHRVDIDRKTAKQSGYFFAGWFTERTAVVNDKGEALDYYGEVASISKRAPAYTYSGKWDFNTPYEVNPNEEHSSYTPVLTLYAGWIPEFRIEFRDYESKELIDTKYFDPTKEGALTINVPVWDMEKGTQNLYTFPKIDYKTFVKAYIGENEISEATFAHTGTYNLDSASYENETMVVYTSYKDGEWYKITKPQQLGEIWNTNGIYEILSDLDFAPVNEDGEVESIVWPFANNTFTGKIIGNGHTISGVYIEQNGTSTQAFGLFGTLKGAEIENITFDKVNAYIGGGTRLPATCFGLFAGTVEADTVLDCVSITESKLSIYLGANFAMTTDHSVGLLCGVDNGTAQESVSYDITLEKVTDEYTIEGFDAEVGSDGNRVIITLK